MKKICYKEITKFIKRLKRININIELFANYPWIYLDSVNDNKVKEKYYSDHKFTIGFFPTRTDQKFNFIDIKEMFRIIRKYK